MGAGRRSGIDEGSDGEGEDGGEDGEDDEEDGEGREGGAGEEGEEGGAGGGEWSRRRRATIDAQWLEGKRGRGAALSLAALWAAGAAVVAVLRRSPGGTTLLVRFGTQWLWGITVLDFVWCYVRFQIAKRTFAARHSAGALLSSANATTVAVATAATVAVGAVKLTQHLHR